MAVINKFVSHVHTLARHPKNDVKRAQVRRPACHGRVIGFENELLQFCKVLRVQVLLKKGDLMIKDGELVGATETDENKPDE